MIRNAGSFEVPYVLVMINIDYKSTSIRMYETRNEVLYRCCRLCHFNIYSKLYRGPDMLMSTFAFAKKIKIMHRCFWGRRNFTSDILCMLCAVVT